MIILYRAENDLHSDKIEEKLNELVVAFKTKIVTEIDDAEPSETTLPYIWEGDNLVNGEENLERYLNELERELHIQRSVSGDACYIDPETGKVC